MTKEHRNIQLLCSLCNGTVGWKYAAKFAIFKHECTEWDGHRVDPRD